MIHLQFSHNYLKKNTFKITLTRQQLVNFPMLWPKYFVFLTHQLTFGKLCRDQFKRNGGEARPSRWVSLIQWTDISFTKSSPFLVGVRSTTAGTNWMATKSCPGRASTEGSWPPRTSSALRCRSEFLFKAPPDTASPSASYNQHQSDNSRCFQKRHFTWSSQYCCCQVTPVVSASVRPHRRQPTRLPHPWDSPGKNTGVGCHFLLQCMKVKSAQSCLTLRDPMDSSPPGSSIHGIFQARGLEWGTTAFSTGQWEVSKYLHWGMAGRISSKSLSTP